MGTPTHKRDGSTPSKHTHRPVRDEQPLGARLHRPEAGEDQPVPQRHERPGESGVGGPLPCVAVEGQLVLVCWGVFSPRERRRRGGGGGGGWAKRTHFSRSPSFSLNTTRSRSFVVRGACVPASFLSVAAAFPILRLGLSHSPCGGIRAGGAGRCSPSRSRTGSRGCRGLALRGMC